MTATLMTPIHDEWPSLERTLRALLVRARAWSIPYELVEPSAADRVCLRLDGGRIVISLAEPRFTVDGHAVPRTQLFAEVRTVAYLYLAADIIRHADQRAAARARAGACARGELL